MTERRPAGTTTRSRRAAWLFVDQGFSSLTNFLISVAVARSVSVSEFGAFTIGITVYYILVEFVRPLAFEPLLIRYSGKEAAAQRHAASGATSAALAVGLVSGVLVLCTALLVPDTVRPVLVALALILPGLLVQDACRYALLAAGRARDAAVNDILWAVLSVGALTVLSFTTSGGADVLFLAWGLAGTVCGVVGLVQVTALPRLRAGWAWVREHRDLSPRFVAEYVIDAGSFQLTVLLVGAIGGLSALAALNGARLLLGPVGVVFLAVSGLAVSEGSRLRDARDRRLVPGIRLMGVVLTLLPLVWVAALLALPRDVGVALLGDTFASAEAVLPLLGLYWAARGAISAAKWGLRIFAAARSSLRAMAVVAPVTLVGGVTGTVLGGAAGAAAGLAVASIAGAVLWWWHLEVVARVFTAGHDPVDVQRRSSL
jgi:O-antigen/teichoic acid export membrane protein